MKIPPPPITTPDPNGGMLKPLPCLVFQAECQKHGILRCAVSECIPWRILSCPKCERKLEVSCVGKATEHYPWTFIDHRTGAAGGRKAGEIRRGKPTKRRRP